MADNVYTRTVWWKGISVEAIQKKVKKMKKKIGHSEHPVYVRYTHIYVFYLIRPYVRLAVRSERYASKIADNIIKYETILFVCTYTLFC